MTPEEILAELRDVALPEIAPGPVAEGYLPEAVLLLAVIAVALVLIRRMRASAWRREAKAELRRIDALSDAPARTFEMTWLFRRIARHVPPGMVPSALFRAPTTLEDTDSAELRARIVRLIG